MQISPNILCLMLTDFRIVWLQASCKSAGNGQLSQESGQQFVVGKRICFIIHSLNRLASLIKDHFVLPLTIRKVNPNCFGFWFQLLSTNVLSEGAFQIFLRKNICQLKRWVSPIGNSANSTTRQKPSICNHPLYTRVTFEPIMLFKRPDPV